MATANATLVNILLDGIDTRFDSGTVQLRTGVGAGATNAAAGSLLATITLPSNSLATASGGTKVMAGTWTTTASATGTIGHYRMVGVGGDVLEGPCSLVGFGGEMQFTVTAVVSGYPVTVATFVLSTNLL